jgi:acetyl esterase/lipase
MDLCRIEGTGQPKTDHLICIPVSHLAKEPMDGNAAANSPVSDAMSGAHRGAGGSGNRGVHSLREAFLGHPALQACIFVCLFAFALLAGAALAEPAGAPSRISYGPEAKQFGELSLPREPGGSRATIILIHGGAWRNRSDLTSMRAAAANLCAQGYAVWNIEYRTLDDAGGAFPTTFRDVGAAADHLRELARTHPLDLTRVIAVGYSAGGHLALWLAARPRLPASSPLYAASPLRMQGVVDLAGPPDLRAGHDLSNAAGGTGTIETLIGAEARGFDIALKDTSPAELLPLGVPQALVFGTLDNVVPLAQARLYQDAAGARGETVDLLVVPGAGHGDFPSTSTKAWREGLRAIEIVSARTSRPE